MVGAFAVRCGRFRGVVRCGRAGSRSDRIFCKMNLRPDSKTQRSIPSSQGNSLGEGRSNSSRIEARPPREESVPFWGPVSAARARQTVLAMRISPKGFEDGRDEGTTDRHSIYCSGPHLHSSAILTRDPGPRYVQMGAKTSSWRVPTGGNWRLSERRLQVGL